jgi:hypothetical protein
MDKTIIKQSLSKINNKEVEKMNRQTADNLNGKYLTILQTCDLTNLGRGTIRKLAEESGAKRKIGNRFMVEQATLLNYIETNCK